VLLCKRQNDRNKRQIRIRALSPAHNTGSRAPGFHARVSYTLACTLKARNKAHEILLRFAITNQEVLLIVFWEAFIFLSTILPYRLVAKIVPPLSILGPLIALAALLGMYQAFDWDTPLTINLLDKFRASSRTVRIIYGPVVFAGWFVQKLFFWSAFSLALIMASPFLLPCTLRTAWKEYRFVSKLRSKGRLLKWRQVLPSVEQGKGFLLLELITVIEDIGWMDENLSRLWWVPPAPTGAASLALPCYRQWQHIHIFSGPEADSCMRRAFQEYQHLEKGTAVLVRIPRTTRKTIKHLLARHLPETAVRVTWITEGIDLRRDDG
jgi:hypothetical protein